MICIRRCFAFFRADSLQYVLVNSYETYIWVQVVLFSRSSFFPPQSMRPMLDVCAIGGGYGTLPLHLRPHRFAHLTLCWWVADIWTNFIKNITFPSSFYRSPPPHSIFLHICTVFSAHFTPHRQSQTTLAIRVASHNRKRGGAGEFVRWKGFCGLKDGGRGDFATLHPLHTPITSTAL